MRNIITGADIEFAKAQGHSQIIVGPDTIITNVARESAERMNIRILEEGAQAVSINAVAPVSAPAPVSPAGTNKPFLPSDFMQGQQTGAPVISMKSQTGVSAYGEKPPYDMEHWRRQFPILENYVHVANCSQSPQSSYTLKASNEYLDSWGKMGMDWDAWMQEVYLSKCEFAKIINADPSEIAIGTSISEITSTLASSLNFNGKRNKIVVTDAEFPTIGNIWMAHKKYGADIQFLPLRNGIIPEEEYDRYVDERTLLSSICDVYYYSGFKQDLASIIPKIHAKGSLVYVDAYQGLGTHPLDVKALDIDMLGSGNLKYLCGIPGVAFLYVKKELIPYLEPAFTGWFGQEDPFAFEIHNLNYAKDARRFDNGTPPVMTAYIARGGMQIINEIGPATVQYWTDILSRHCIAGAEARGLDVASPKDIRYKAPTTAIRVPGNSHDVELKLREKKIIASARGDVVRIAPHFFTRLEDIDYVLDCFVEILRRR